MDPRVESLARILVRYSVGLNEGDTCLIEGPSAGEPLITTVY
jgi:leucyl aminopeptidase (aminopeptidase T)